MFTLGPTTHATLMVDKNEFNLLWMKLNIQIELHIHVNKPKKKGLKIITKVIIIIVIKLINVIHDNWIFVVFRGPFLVLTQRLWIWNDLKSLWSPPFKKNRPIYYLGAKIPEATILYNESQHNILAYQGKAKKWTKKIS
jgi:hypothetical protein